MNTKKNFKEKLSDIIIALSSSMMKSIDDEDALQEDLEAEQAAIVKDIAELLSVDKKAIYKMLPEDVLEELIVLRESLAEFNFELFNEHKDEMKEVCHE